LLKLTANRDQSRIWNGSHRDMRARNAKYADDSSMNTSDLSSIDQGEASEILASLGKKYSKSVGMGKSLDINKLRQLQGINRIMPKTYHQQERTGLHHF
jgi:hypothetical protein